MKFYKLISTYIQLIKYCFAWSFDHSRPKLLSCIAKGLLSTMAVYASLGILALIVNSIQTHFSGLEAPHLMLSDKAFIVEISSYLFLSILSAWLNRSFFKDSYQLWASQASAVSHDFLQRVKQLPDPKFGCLNFYYLDHPELFRNSSGRPRSLGAFSHYTRVMFLEAVKVVVFASSLFYLAPTFACLIFICFLMFLPWVVRSHWKSAKLSEQVELQQRKAALERQSYLSSDDHSDNSAETRSLFDMLTTNYFQAKTSQFYSYLANVLSGIVVLIFVLLSENQGEYDFAYWIPLIVLGRLLASAIMQLLSSLMLMSRQASLAQKIKSVLERFDGTSSDINLTLKGHSKQSDAVSLDSGEIAWIYQSKIFPKVDDLNAFLYLVDDSSINHSIDSVVIDQTYIECEAGFLLDNKTINNDLALTIEDCAKACGFNSLLQFIASDEKLKSKASLRVVQIELCVVKNILENKRIFISNGLLWAVDLKRIRHYIFNHKSQLFVFFSASSRKSPIPNDKTPVLQYDYENGFQIVFDFMATPLKSSGDLGNLEMGSLEE